MSAKIEVDYLDLDAGREMDRMVSARVFESDDPFPPAYSTDIAAAWKVVERMAAQYCFQLDNVGFEETGQDADGNMTYRDAWRCGIGWSDDPIGELEEGATPALAICRTALEAVAAAKAKGEKVGD